VVVDRCSACSSHGVVSILLGNGDGTFATAIVYDAGQWPILAGTADLNGDGKPDLVITNPCGETILNCAGDGFAGIFLSNGDGTFQSPVYYDMGPLEPGQINVVDMNGDGTPDLVATGWPHPGSVRVFLNDGSGKFTLTGLYQSGGSEPYSTVVTDLNQDGKPDVVVVHSDKVGVLLGNGDGSFSSTRSYSYGASRSGSGFLAIADINGDGTPDVVATSTQCSLCIDTAVSVLLGNGDGALGPFLSFADVALGDFRLADVNGDNKPDLLGLGQCGSTGCTGYVGILLNNTIRPYNPTTTTLASSANPSIANQAITYTATVTSQNGGTATGTVTFTDLNLGCVLPSTTAPCPTVTTVPVSGNQAKYATSYKENGSHLITAVYSSDANNGISTSAALSEFIAALPVASKTSVTTSGSPSTIGQPVTFSATITWKYGAVPDGELVSFYDGVTALGTTSTSGGIAIFSTGVLSAKTHAVKAIYAGDSRFKTSSGTTQQVVDLYATTTTISSNPNPSNYGQAVTLAAQVEANSSAVPTGTVVFKNGTTSLGTASVDPSGRATLTTTRLPVASNSLTALYRGDSLHGKSISAEITQVVNQSVVGMTLSSSPNPSSFGKPVKLTATFTSNGGLPTGSGNTVTFTSAGATLGTVTIPVSGVATLMTSALPRGSDVVTATYAGSANYSAVEESLIQTVQ